MVVSIYFKSYQSWLLVIAIINEGLFLGNPFAGALSSHPLREPFAGTLLGELFAGNHSKLLLGTPCWVSGIPLLGIRRPLEPAGGPHRRGRRAVLRRPVRRRRHRRPLALAGLFAGPAELWPQEPLRRQQPARQDIRPELQRGRLPQHDVWPPRTAACLSLAVREHGPLLVLGAGGAFPLPLSACTHTVSLSYHSI